MHQSGHSSLAAAVSRCQILAGRALEAPLCDLLYDVRNLVSDGSVGETLAEQIAIRMLLTQVLGRLASANDLDTNQDVALAFIGLAAAPPIAATWRAQLERVVDCLVQANTAPPQRFNRQAGRILELIAIRSHNGSLTLDNVAKDANLSSCYVARILKDHTGTGFVAHVRQSRVTAAHRLLSGTTLSVKEVSAAVGYQSSRQLDRDFKRVSGVTPTLFRERACLISPRRSVRSPK